MEIKIEHLNKNYGKQSALKDISLHIPVGMYGLLGENGAGKTTLMRILATMLELSTGTVKINGIDIKQERNPKNYRLSPTGILGISEYECIFCVRLSWDFGRTS